MTILVPLVVIAIVVLIATVIQDIDPGVSAIDWIPGRASPFLNGSAPLPPDPSDCRASLSSSQNSFLHSPWSLSSSYAHLR
jgi:hypothetical protein